MTEPGYSAPHRVVSAVGLEDIAGHQEKGVVVIQEGEVSSVSVNMRSQEDRMDRWGDCRKGEEEERRNNRRATGESRECVV